MDNLQNKNNTGDFNINKGGLHSFARFSQKSGADSNNNEAYEVLRTMKGDLERAEKGEEMPAPPIISENVTPLELPTTEIEKPGIKESFPLPPPPPHSISLPSPPLPPPSLDEELTEEAFEEIGVPKIFSWKKVGLITAIIIGIAVISGSAYVFLYKGMGFWPIKISPDDPIIVKPAPVLPESLIEVDNVDNIGVNLSDQADILNKFNNLQNIDLIDGEIERIAFSADKGDGMYFLGWREFSESLQIKIPLTIKEKMAADFTLAITKGEGINDIILAVKAPFLTEEELSLWESSMSDDLSPLLNSIGAQEAQTMDFQYNSYKGVTIRYKNFSDAEKTIDYAYLTDKQLLTITTSKKSMFLAIDRIKSAGLDNKLIDVKNCGSVLNTHIFVSPKELTAQEESSLGCIDQALSSCEPASIQFSGEDGGFYKILRVKDDKCVIEQVIDSESQICELPVSFIEISKDRMKEIVPPNQLFILTIPFAFTAEKITDIVTGQEIEITCY